MGQTSREDSGLDLSFATMKRNPYLVDYTEYKRERQRRASGAGVQAKPPERRTTKLHSVPDRNSRNARRIAAMKRRRQIFYRRLALITGMAVVGMLCVVLAVWGLETNENQGKGSVVEAAGQGEDRVIFDDLGGKEIQGISAADFGKHPTWTEDFLTPNDNSRPGDALEEVNSIFVHYTANKGTSAAQNRSYFESLKDTHETSASAHFIIGYEGEIIQCIPLNEIAYAVQTRNFDSISIECCYLENDGSFTQATYDSLISLLRWLMDVYDLESEDILRHYDCGGKKCPLFYTDNPDEWEKLKREL